MSIIRHRKIFYIISGLFVVLSIASLIFRGINFGSDFTGDAELEVEFREVRPARDVISKTVSDAGVHLVSLSEVGERGYDIRTDYITEEEHVRMLEALRGLGELDEKGFTSIGPSVGKQLRRNAVLAIGIALLAIILFIAFAFRHVARPVSSWIYGIVALVALAHDVIIPTGLFSFLQIRVDSLFVSALLTVLGFSIHDTIVVFDRVRENLRLDYGHKGSDFETIVGKSINQTFVRSINTSLSTLLALIVLYILGPSTTQLFSLVLIIGVTVGTYSSIFIASPLLVTVEKWQRNRLTRK